MEQDANHVHAHGRFAAIVIDERSAPRLATAVGEVWGEIDAGGASAAVGQPDAAMKSRSRHGASASLIAGALILGLCGGRWQAGNSAQVVAHAGPPGGWLTESPQSAPPMFGAGAASRAGTGDPTMRRTSSLTAAALATTINAAMTAGALAGDAVQWRVEDGGNGHWYAVVQNLSCVAEFSAYALRHGSHLVTVSSNGENDFIHTVIADAPGQWAYIGFAQDHTAPDFQEPAGGWRWINGEPVTYVAWGGNEPNNGGATGIPEDWIIVFPEALYWVDARDCVADRAIIEWSADCNSDGIVDYGQILTGALADANSNGIPDTCECATNPSLPSCCPGDIYRNGRVDGADLGALLSEWGPVTPLTNSDLDGNGQVNGADLGILLSHWGPCGG